jgi:hypothetical protein
MTARLVIRKSTTRFIIVISVGEKTLRWYSNWIPEKNGAKWRKFPVFPKPPADQLLTATDGNPPGFP